MSFDGKNIPLELKERKQWVVYFKRKVEGSEHLGKVMVSPNTYRHARSNEPSDWAGFDKADLFASSFKRADGLAFVLTEGIVFIDIDNSIDEKGNLSQIAKKLLAEFPLTYAERSCSGRGIHILMKGSLPKDCMKRNDAIGLEMYDAKRFCCVTGDVISQSKELYDYSDKIARIATHLMGRKVANPTPKPYYGRPSISDQQIVEKAMRSKSGAKFARLYSGDRSGYASPSSADLALVSMIAFYTQDPSQIDHIFRTSGLYREKWDSPRGDSTYGMMTIMTSLGNTRTVFEEMQ
jgi:putative DNA primase/helicase